MVKIFTGMHMCACLFWVEISVNFIKPSNGTGTENSSVRTLDSAFSQLICELRDISSRDIYSHPPSLHHFGDTFRSEWCTIMTKWMIVMRDDHWFSPTFVSTVFMKFIRGAVKLKSIPKQKNSSIYWQAQYKMEKVFSHYVTHFNKSAKQIAHVIHKLPERSFAQCHYVI